MREVYSKYKMMLQHKTVVYTLLLLWGIAVAATIIIPNAGLPIDETGNAISPYVTYMDFNLYMSEFALSQIESGELPNMVTLNDNTVNVLQPWYVFNAYISFLLGNKTTWQAVLFVSMLSSGVLIALYPVFFYNITGSLLTALISAPIIAALCYNMIINYKSDYYWALSFAMLFCLPLLYIVFSEPLKLNGWMWWALLLFGIAFSNLIRPQASLTVWLLLLAIVILRLFPFYLKDRRIAFLGLRCTAIFCAVFFVCFSSSALFCKTIPNIINRAVDYEGQLSSKTNAGFHSLYIGIGWEENPFGIVYEDAQGIRAVAEVTQNAPFHSEKYLETLKRLFIQKVSQNPIWFLQSYTRKFFAILKIGIDYIGQETLKFADIITFGMVSKQLQYKPFTALLWVYVAVGLWQFFKNFLRKRYTKWLFLLGILAVLGGMVTPMIAIPAFYYSLGSVSGFVFLLFVIFITLIPVAVDKISEVLGNCG